MKMTDYKRLGKSYVKEEVMILPRKIKYLKIKVNILTFKLKCGTDLNKSWLYFFLCKKILK